MAFAGGLVIDEVFVKLDLRVLSDLVGLADNESLPYHHPENEQQLRKIFINILPVHDGLED